MDIIGNVGVAVAVVLAVALFTVWLSIAAYLVGFGFARGIKGGDDGEDS